jgi:3-isopropylmalate/(R)-2-methylmalate dehydratase small subunit
MKPFHRVTGTAIPLSRTDIDTDAIIPQRWLITTERDGLGKGFFANWRYHEGTLDPRPECVLNDPRFHGARIIVAAPNYGCGSSREHAVWAHLDYGIEAVIASSFGSIFYDNALKNGLALIVLEQSDVSRILEQLDAGPCATMSVDLERNEVRGPDGRLYLFEMEEQRRLALLMGRDEITATLDMSDAIDAFQKRDRLDRPWVWPE